MSRNSVADRQAEAGDVHHQLPREPQALVDLKGAVEVRVVDQALPADHRPRLLEIHPHDDQQLGGVALAPRSRRSAGVVERRRRDRGSSTARRRRAAGRPVPPGSRRSPAPRAGDPGRAASSERDLRLEDRGGRQGPRRADAEVGGAGACRAAALGRRSGADQRAGLGDRRVAAQEHLGKARRKAERRRLSRSHFATMRRQCPQLDQGWRRCCRLKDRGLLESTLVWCCGEFGRGPKVDWQPPWNGGRNHYGNVFTVLVAGGGFKGGHVVGSSDAKAEEVKERPVYPVDLLGSIYQLAGIDATRQAAAPDGLRGPRAARPVGRREVGRPVDGDHVDMQCIVETVSGRGVHDRRALVAGAGRAAGDGGRGAGAAAAVHRFRLSGRRPAGTTFQVRLGGQGLDGLNARRSSPARALQAKVVEYLRRTEPTQEMRLLQRASSRELDEAARHGRAGSTAVDAEDDRARIEERLAEYVQTPACASISNLVLVEVTIAPDAEPGQRELRLATPRGVSNPLVFHVGQLPEVCRKPMLTATLQVLGKEELALRKRPDDEVEQRITLPCTVNGQIASGEVNRYRFEARKGQRLVISTAGAATGPVSSPTPFPAGSSRCWRSTTPAGKEVAYDDDYRFKPDPVILFEVPKDGEYVLAITTPSTAAARISSIASPSARLPFVTSIFPLGGRVGDAGDDRDERLESGGGRVDAAAEATPGRASCSLAARRKGFVSNRVPFALDTLPECFEKEPNNDPAHAQKVTLPVIINGRIDRPDDWDVFQFTGQAGETVVAEVYGPAARFPAGFRAQAHRRRRASCWPSTTTTKTWDRA